MGPVSDDDSDMEELLEELLATDQTNAADIKAFRSELKQESIARFAKRSCLRCFHPSIRLPKYCNPKALPTKRLRNHLKKRGWRVLPTYCVALRKLGPYPYCENLGASNSIPQKCHPRLLPKMP